ncbi:hypothetical protein RE428_35450 [Marinobacter nanhaiticus D15-8W]|nr:hypothetical protein RE428_35450 [Marinobacter nanhaiticus D15-8W]
MTTLTQPLAQFAEGVRHSVDFRRKGLGDDGDMPLTLDQVFSVMTSTRADWMVPPIAVNLCCLRVWLRIFGAKAYQLWGSRAFGSYTRTMEMPDDS